MKTDKIESIDEAVLRAEFAKTPDLQNQYSSADAYVAGVRAEKERKARTFGGDVEAEMRETINTLEARLKQVRERNEILRLCARTDDELRDLFASSRSLQDHFSCADALIAFVRHAEPSDV
ncbi:MAG: hypothetical protein A2Z25_12040 [Planctomycetes bacterium RBG_16_55_9]|nr:MAG: hypothetical protein A2Z25_12040 [Planctomycetes bacterium RBG_16_55_9]